jgi:hypothetical protein
MANVTTPITRELNKAYKGRCPRIQVSLIGSFVALRIDDPEGQVSMKLSQEVAKVAADLMMEAEIIEAANPISFGYWMSGVVINWRSK